MGRNKYTFEDAYAASVKYFDGDELAAKVWVSKYALKDSYGNISRIERPYPNPLSEDQIFELLDKFAYIVPQGSPMAGIGNDFQTGSLSNCFVVGLDGHPDSYGSIIKIDEEQVQLMKRRGGVGHDLSDLRPKGMPVKNDIRIRQERWHRMAVVGR